MRIKKAVKRILLGLGIPSVATYLWARAYGWLYYIPQGQLRWIDVLVPNLTSLGVFALWLLGVMYIIGSSKEKKD